MKIIAYVITVLLSFFSGYLAGKRGVENESDSNLNRLSKFCNNGQLTKPISIFNGFLWLPSNLTVNTERSIKESKTV